MPGGVLYWVSIHPFIRFWRRLGPRVTLAIHFFFMSLLGLVFFLFRAPLLAVEFGSNALLVAFGVILLATSVALRVRLSRQLTKKVLMGVAELAPNPDRFPLLTKGIYSRVRNPRYLQVMLAVLGWALIANYLESYIVFAATVVLLRIVIEPGGAYHPNRSSSSGVSP